MEAKASIEGPRSGARILRVDPEYGNARVPADERGQVGRLGEAAATPGAPDVDDDDPAGVVREAQPLAGDDVGSGKRRRLKRGGGDQCRDEPHEQIVADGRSSPATSRSV